MDAEGNKIELWEPIDSVFTAMRGKTTKQKKMKANRLTAPINLLQAGAGDGMLFSRYS